MCRCVGLVDAPDRIARPGHSFPDCLFLVYLRARLGRRMQRVCTGTTGHYVQIVSERVDQGLDTRSLTVCS